MEETQIEYKAKRKPLMVILFFSVGIVWLFVIIPLSMAPHVYMITVIVALLIVSILMVRRKKRIRFYNVNNIKELRYVKISLMYFLRAFDFYASEGAS